MAASCTSTGEPIVTAGLPAYTATDTAVAAPQDDVHMALAEPSAPGTLAEPETLTGQEGDTALPEQLAYVPTANPAIAAAAQETPAVATAALPIPAQDAAAAGQAVETAAASPAPELAAAPAIPSQRPAADGEASKVTATAQPQQAIAPKKKGFLAAFFGSSSAKAPPTPVRAAKPLIAQDQPVKPIVASASSGIAARPLALTSANEGAGWSGDALPGVRQTALFEITRKSGLDDDSDVDINEDGGMGSFQIASAAGLARLAPNGLLKQSESVDVACLKPALVRVLKIIESHYGKKLVVTSGYRDPTRNRRARGARNSLHMYCAAADVQVPGVSKWDLAAFVRSMPGRGGVGTYCHTNSVHIDVGPERDWNWRCRRRK